MEYREFRVIVEDENRLRIIKPSGTSQKASIPMDSLKERTINIFHRWLAEGNIKSRDELVVLGAHLYNGLFDDEISRAFLDEFNKVRNQESTTLRLRLEFEREAHKLAQMPWEYIYYPDNDMEKGFFIATRGRLILTRHVPLKIEDLKAEGNQLRILLVVSKPEGEGLNTVKADSIISTIAELKSRLPHIVTDELLQPNKRSLTDKVKEFRPHVLHFIGHGEYKGEGGRLLLVQEQDQKTAAPISDIDFADCFLDYQPRLIFLHACEGARSDSYEAFRGVALQLVYSKVPAVVAMQYPVENLVANNFARKFYEALGEGKRIDEAVQEGRAELAMYLNEQNFSSRAFGSPLVYLQSAEGIIIAETQPPALGLSPQPPSSKVNCPYSNDCSGMVIRGDKFCITCRRPLMQCPNCDGVMAQALGVHGCGYGIESKKPIDTTTEGSQGAAAPGFRVLRS